MRSKRVLSDMLTTVKAVNAVKRSADSTYALESSNVLTALTVIRMSLSTRDRQWTDL